MEPIASAWCSDGMRRLLLVVLAALLLPAAAHAKGITGFALCGPSECEDGDVSRLGHQAPFYDETNGPPPGRYYRVDLRVDGQSSGWTLFYEPVTGLVAREARPGTWLWSRLAPQLATFAKDAARRIEAFPRPRVTGARVGSKHIAGPSYAALLRVAGPPVVPTTSARAVTMALLANRPNPWTQASLLWYPEDKVLFRSPGTYVRVPDGIAADIDAARPLGAGDGPIVPWIPIAVLCAGALILLVPALRRTPSREVAPVH
jgi:hypothetical protein